MPYVFQVLSIIGVYEYQFIQKRSPWYKETRVASRDIVILLESIRIQAVALSPVTPLSRWLVYKQLGYTSQDFNNLTWCDTEWGGLKAGKKLAQPAIIFPKFEGSSKYKDVNLLEDLITIIG